MTDGSRFAVVGTDTAVGKTIVTAALTAMFRDRNHAARAVKPVQTGHPPDDDAAVVVETCDDPAAAVCLGYLEPALAPRVAAAESGTTLSFVDIRADCETALAETEVGILEGVGGLRVPITDDRDVIDLVAALDCPALLVTRSGLGTLNHTALSVEALGRHDIPVLGILCNEYRGGSLAERTNPAEMERMTGCPVATVPPVAGSDPAAVARELVPSLPATVLDWLPLPE